MLLADPVEPWRPCPPERPLLRPGASPRLARLKSLRSLPTVLHLEDGAGVLEPSVQRRQALRPAQLVVIEGIPQEVVVAIALSGQLGDPPGVLVDASESPRPVRREVELGLPCGDPLGERSPEPAGAPEAVQREPGGHPQATHVGDGADERVRVGRHRVRVADELHDLRVRDEGEPASCPSEQLLEPIHVGRDGPGPVLPRRAVDPPSDRVGFVAAQDNAAGLGFAVDEVVGISEARHVPRELPAGHRLQGDVLVIDRRRRDPHSGHRRDPRRPDAGGVHNHLALDPVGPCPDGGDLAPVGKLDPRHAFPRPDPDTEALGGVRQGVGRRVRVEEAVTGEPDTAEQRLAARRRHPLQRLVGREELHLESDPPGP